MKSKGGKWCFVLMLGTRAQIMPVLLMGNVPSEHAEKFPSMLLEAGREQAGLTAEKSPALSQDGGNQLKTEMGCLDDGKRHTWRHVLAKSVVRPRRTTLAVGLAGFMFLSTACGAGQGAGVDNDATASPSISLPAPAGPSITGGVVIKTDKGEYLQSTIADDDPAMQYDPATALGTPEDHLSREQIEDAHKFTVRYIAEDVIDSPLNDNASSVDSWWNENKRIFDPAYHDAIRQDFVDRDGPVVRNKWHEDVAVDYEYGYVYSSTETRISDRNIKIYETYYSENSMLVFKAKYDYSAKVPTPDGIGYEKVSGEYVVGLRPSDAGESDWVITHYDSEYTVDDFIDPAE